MSHTANGATSDDAEPGNCDSVELDADSESAERAGSEARGVVAVAAPVAATDDEDVEGGNGDEVVYDTSVDGGVTLGEEDAGA